jgi:hypothetical protein
MWQLMWRCRRDRVFVRSGRAGDGVEKMQRLGVAWEDAKSLFATTGAILDLLGAWIDRQFDRMESLFFLTRSSVFGVYSQFG